jgi:hypothetical protein
VYHGDAAMPKRTIESPEFTITLSKGMATRHRLLLDHVIDVLREFKAMVKDVGIAIQRENGVQYPTGDFGIELLATASGKVFRRGSIDATAAITLDVANGLKAVDTIITTANAIEKKKEIPLEDAKGRRIVRGLMKISDVQKMDKTEFEIKRVAPNAGKKSAKVTERGVQQLQALESDAVRVDGVTVFGKLLELRDRSQSEEMGDRFWGELRGDNDEVWRVQFDSKRDADKATRLFTKQVEVYGDATYFKAKSPRLVARKFKEDARRNYVAAFDELEGSDKDLYGTESLEDLIDESRGGDN